MTRQSLEHGLNYGSPYPINWLELEAIRLALRAFKAYLERKHILVMCDNKSAVAYINKQGGTRSKRLFTLSRIICLWCRSQDVRLKCRHIEGSLNVEG